MDVDSTFITAEVIELIARRAGSETEVARITESAMRGELDFAASLHQRVAALAGVPEREVAAIAEEVTLSTGVPELLAYLAQRDWPVGLVSGGFLEVVRPLAERWGIQHVRANALEVGADGRLTGRVSGAVVDRAAKAAALREFAEIEGVALRDTVAIGDGANDIDMLQSAGLGIAFNAKPALAERADVCVSSMTEVIDLLR